MVHRLLGANSWFHRLSFHAFLFRDSCCKFWLCSSLFASSLSSYRMLIPFIQRYTLFYTYSSEAALFTVSLSLQISAPWFLVCRFVGDTLWSSIIFFLSFVCVAQIFNRILTERLYSWLEWVSFVILCVVYIDCLVQYRNGIWRQIEFLQILFFFFLFVYLCGNNIPRLRDFVVYLYRLQQQQFNACTGSFILFVEFVLVHAIYGFISYTECHAPPSWSLTHLTV